MCYVTWKFDSYAKEDGGFGGEAHFGDVMLQWR
jgi:hypothetical protein